MSGENMTCICFRNVRGISPVVSHYNNWIVEKWYPPIRMLLCCSQNITLVHRQPAVCFKHLS